MTAQPKRERERGEQLPSRPVAGTFRVYLPDAESRTELGLKSYLPLLTFVNVNNITALQKIFDLPLCVRSGSSHPSADFCGKGRWTFKLEKSIKSEKSN